jgi:hypothetical protein
MVTVILLALSYITENTKRINMRVVCVRLQDRLFCCCCYFRGNPDDVYMTSQLQGLSRRQTLLLTFMWAIPSVITHQSVSHILPLKAVCYLSHFLYIYVYKLYFRGRVA